MKSFVPDIVEFTGIAALKTKRYRSALKIKHEISDCRNRMRLFRHLFFVVFFLHI